jgi:MFS family permease
MLWGSVLALHAAAKDFGSLVVLRTLLGTFEACCQPSFIMLSSMWYRREEQAQTVAYWYMMNGGQQIVGKSCGIPASRVMDSDPLQVGFWRTHSPTSLILRSSFRGKRSSFHTALAQYSGGSLCSSICQTLR